MDTARNILDTLSSRSGNSHPIQEIATQNDSPVYSENKRPTTDIGNSERFEDIAEGCIKYVSEMDQWIKWENDRWVAINSVYDFAKTVIRSIYQESSQCEDVDRRQKLAYWAASSENKARVDAMINLASRSSHIQVPVQLLDSDPSMIGCANGIISLDSGTLSSTDKSQYITKSVSASFDNDAQCPVWERFLYEIMDGKKDMVQFLQRLSGYALYGGNPEQVLPILHGGGANGKSVFINTLKDLFGDYSKKIEPSTLTVSKHGQSAGGAREDLVRLYRCRLGVTTETADGDRLDESFVKAVSGGEEVTARGIHARKSIEYKPEYLVMLATNHVPTIVGTDDGIWRRIVLIPFNVSFKGREDRELPQRLRSESDGILNWLLTGYSEWRRVGLSMPKRVLEATNSYKTDQDALGEWLDEHCRIKPSNTCPSADAYESYRNWAIGAGMFPLSKRRFTTQLAERGHEKVHDGYKKPYLGFSLRR